MISPAVSVIKSDLPEKWQQILSDLITDPKELLQLLDLDPEKSPFSLHALQQFPLKVPRPFVELIEKSNWDDPLLRQIWPSKLEEHEQTGFVSDPLAESNYNPVAGLLHKYHGRVLLTAAPHCAIHCRYCFRRHFDYQSNSPSRQQWEAAFEYIHNDSSIDEVILSGGDPLALSNRQLFWLLEQIDQIPHITRLRIHSRLPIVIPQRINSDLLNCLGRFRQKVVLVIHCNHSHELTTEMAGNFHKLATNGVTVLNQSVLLKDVNDSASCLIELSKALFSHNVLPYYLHLPDRVSGTAHFYTDEAHARDLLNIMQARLPGYLVPHLVSEIQGEASKTRIM